MDQDIDALIREGGGADLFYFYQHFVDLIDFDREESRSQFLKYLGIEIDTGRILLKIRRDAIVNSYHKEGIPVPEGDISLNSGNEYIAYYNRIWPERKSMTETEYYIQVVMALESNARVWWPTFQGCPNESFLNYPDNDVEDNRG